LANTLYEYYTQQGLEMPTWQERIPTAEQAGISDYTGTEQQNVSLLAYLQKQPSSELGVMTSDIADSYVQQGNQTLDKLSGVETKTPIETKPTPTSPETETGKIKFLNLSGQTQEKDQNITPEEYQNLINQGYYVIESSGSIPSWVTTGDVQSGKMQAELNQAREEKDQLIADMSKYMVSDAQLNSQIQGINAMYDSRIADMERINRQREGAIKTLGVRIGSRYTGGEGGVFGGIITEEERQASARITELQNQKMQAVNAAKSAAQQQNWQVYGKQLDLAQKKYEEQTKAVEDYNKLLVEGNKKILEDQKTKLEIDKLKMDIGIKKAETLAPFILDYLTGDSATDAKLIKTIADIQGYEYDYLLGAISKAQGEKEKTTSTSDILNWQEAKRGGYTGTFEKWQTDEANRRAKANITAGGGLDWKTTNLITQQSDKFSASPIVKTFNEVQNKYMSVANIVENGVGGPADLALVFEFMKSLDPSSVVREAEYETAAKSGNIFKGWAAKFNGYLKEEGGFLPDNVKQEFVKLVKIKYDAIQSQYTNLRNETARTVGLSTGLAQEDVANRLPDYNYDIFGDSAGEEYDLNGVIYIKGADGNYYPK